MEKSETTAGKCASAIDGVSDGPILRWYRRTYNNAGDSRECEVILFTYLKVGTRYLTRGSLVKDGSNRQQTNSSNPSWAPSLDLIHLHRLLLYFVGASFHQICEWHYEYCA